MEDLATGSTRWYQDLRRGKDNPGWFCLCVTFFLWWVGCCVEVVLACALWAFDGVGRACGGGGRGEGEVRPYSSPIRGIWVSAKRGSRARPWVLRGVELSGAKQRGAAHRGENKGMRISRAASGETRERWRE